MLNIEKYKDEIIDEWRESEESDLLEDISAVAIRHGKSLDSVEQVVDWLCEEYHESLLTDEDKEFLADLMKWYTFERIHINLCNEIVLVDDYKVFHVCKPKDIFEKLEKLKCYTLEELGL